MPCNTSDICTAKQLAWKISFTASLCSALDHITADWCARSAEAQREPINAILQMTA